MGMKQKILQAMEQQNVTAPQLAKRAQIPLTTLRSYLYGNTEIRFSAGLRITNVLKIKTK